MELDNIFIPAEMIKEILEQLKNICRTRIQGFRRVNRLFNYLLHFSNGPILCSVILFDSTIPHTYACIEYEYWRTKKFLDFSHSISTESNLWLPRDWKKSTSFVMDELY